MSSQKNVSIQQKHLQRRNHFTRNLLCLLTCALTLGLSLSTAHTSELDGDIDEQGWQIELGFGAELEPQFAGAENRQVEPSPFINITYQRDKFQYYTSVVDYGLIYSVAPKWSLGLSTGLEVGRDEDDDQALEGLGNIDDTWELRLDVAYHVNKTLTLGGRAMTAGAEKDNVYFLAAFVDIPTPSNAMELELRTDISWGSRQHLQTEFGVTEEQASNSGYPAYFPSAGLKSVGVAINGKYNFSKNWFAFTEFSYEKYDSAGVDSPFTENDYDIEAELGLAYRY